MDILKILEESGKDLYLEDLDFFETELATGGQYDEFYQAQCRSKINELRAWLSGDAEESEEAQSEEEKKPNTPAGLVMGIGDLAPKGSNSVADFLTPEQIIFHEIAAMREDDSYKTRFKKSEIDAAFVDAHYSFFKPWELEAIISVKQMGEEFNEKYFGALDHDKIARYQLFSEAFFMKHFSQLDYKIVLEHGKNNWRKKENRSKQLDVFLRLKGVKI